MIAVNDPVPAPTIRDAAQVDDIAVVRELDPQNVRLARSRISREPRPGSEPGFLRADRRAPPIPSRRVSGGGVGWLAFCVPVAECLGTEAPPVLAKNSLARAGVSVIRVDPRKSTPAKRSPLSYPPWGSFRQHHYRYPEILAKSPANAPTLTHDVIIVATALAAALPTREAMMGQMITCYGSYSLSAMKRWRTNAFLLGDGRGY